MTMNRTSLDALKRTAKSLGSPFFDADTLRWFNGKLYSGDVFTSEDGQTWAFLTSEKMWDSVDWNTYEVTPNPRRYTVRIGRVVKDENGERFSVDDVDGFDRFDTLAKARTALHKWLAENQ